VNIDLLLSGGSVSIDSDAQWTIRLLKNSDKQHLLEMREQVISGLEDPDWMREEANESAFVDLLLRSTNLVLALFKKHQLVAYTAVILPEQPDDLIPFGLETELCRFAPVTSSAYVAATMVSIGHRGEGLQNRLTSLRHKAMESLSRSNIFATAALGNYYSWRNAMRNGYRAVSILEIRDIRHGLLERMLLHRNDSGMQYSDERVWCDPLDTATQRQCLNRGMVGTCWREHKGMSQIGYQVRQLETINKSSGSLYDT
jgi:hypothetical protein